MVLLESRLLRQDAGALGEEISADLADDAVDRFVFVEHQARRSIIRIAPSVQSTISHQVLCPQ